MNSLSTSLTLSILSFQTNITQNLHKKPEICNPKQTTLDNSDASSLHRQTTLLLATKNEKLKRREAILGGGATIGIISSILLLPSQFVEASEVAASSCEFNISPSGLGFCDKVVGNGTQAVNGQLIKAHYTGKLESGKVFDSSYNSGKPLTFRVGAGEVIKGWDQGILGTEGVPPMLAGGKRTLMIPPELGYGIRGAGCRGGTCIIPPNSVLIFDVEFLGKV